MDLEKKAKILRRKTLDVFKESGTAHPGGCFSEIEILISLYNHVLKPEDKFVLSKGHACQSFYPLLRERRYNPELSGHPDIDIKNGIECTTGSLGHGLPIATGMALAKKFQNQKGYIYVLMGDGECQEGTTWETVPLATKYELNNLTIIVDNNLFQGIEEVKNVSPINLYSVFKAFGCDVTIINGHSFSEIIGALEKKVHKKPKVIIADTIKGKGISFMENRPEWHGKMPTEQEFEIAYKELK